MITRIRVDRYFSAVFILFPKPFRIITESHDRYLEHYGNQMLIVFYDWNSELFVDMEIINKKTGTMSVEQNVIRVSIPDDCAANFLLQYVLGLGIENYYGSI